MYLVLYHNIMEMLRYCISALLTSLLVVNEALSVIILVNVIN